MIRFCVGNSSTPLTKRLHRSICRTMQINVVTGSMAHTLHNIVQKLFLLEHAQELVRLQCDSDVLGARVLTKDTANPFPKVLILSIVEVPFFTALSQTSMSVSSPVRRSSSEMTLPSNLFKEYPGNLSATYYVSQNARERLAANLH